MRRAAGGGAVLVVLLGLYLFLGPSQIGGPVTYVVTSGTSMNPLLHKGDLAIVRKRETYTVGDVVLYRSHTIDNNVLHRIKARDGGRLITRGDNNTFDDGEHPLASDVRGELWFHVPAVGGYLRWLQEPMHAALFLGVLVLLAMGGGSEAVRRRNRRPVSGAAPTPSGGGGAVGFPTGAVVVGAAGAAVLFAGLALVAGSRSETRSVTVPKAYAHEGTFSWSADTWKSVVYPEGRVENGEPVFTRLVRGLDVAFDYTLAARGTSDIHGGVRIEAVVADGTGWSRTLPVAGDRAFRGSRVTATGVLDVRALVQLVGRMRRLTGSPVSTYTVTLAPKVEMTGVAGDAVVDETFAPKLALVLDNVSLRLEAPEADPSGTAGGEEAAPSSPLSVVENRDGVRVEPAGLELGPVSLAVEDARRIGALGLVISLLVAGIAWVIGTRRREASSLERMLAGYGDRIVDASVAIGDDRLVTELVDVHGLLQLAERYDRVVLHERQGNAHVLVVDDGVAVYRCRVTDEPATTVHMKAARA